MKIGDKVVCIGRRMADGFPDDMKKFAYTGNVPDFGTVHTITRIGKGSDGQFYVALDDTKIINRKTQAEGTWPAKIFRPLGEAFFAEETDPADWWKKEQS